MSLLPPYCLVKPFLFALDAEAAHDATLSGLKRLNTLGLLPAVKTAGRPVQAMGLSFPNPVGLAAGLDKNGECIAVWDKLGFGFIEVGTTTPRPQPGNPKPRMFRIVEKQAIINRLGFNNHGVDALLHNVNAANFKGILGINIGKNFDTPIERAADDYLICLDKVYLRASYVTVNISSPNTVNLRQLQSESELDALLGVLKARQTVLADKHGRYVPLTLKIAPDLDDVQITNIADALRRHRIDGVIATNTTVGREGVGNLRYASETGGLSGGPLFEKSTAVVRKLAKALANELPIIGVGGITSAASAKAKIEAGAALVQIYTGMIYRGPELIEECVTALQNNR
jgi:dihydroorotate dehydrogenase